MKREFFGTDGIRGTANTEPMTAEIALKVGMAAGKEFVRGEHRHRVVIAKDTRLSGYMIENALTAGFLSVGMDVYLLGPLPTPAVGMLARAMRADIGVMISASHNAYLDNGIKLFGPDGFKLSDEVEARIEARMQNSLEECLTDPAKIGRAKRIDDAQGRYIEFVKSTFSKEKSLDGLKIVIDCANGAGYKVGPIILWELGAEVIPIHIEPNGTNINKECGSTHPESLCKAVIEHGADLGIALDGDADRLVMCDEKGEMLDGDQLMAMVATRWKQRGMLSGDAVVSTQMANLGFEQYLAAQGVQLHRTQVGDRYVMEKMRADNLTLGGEPSGHIILSDYSTTGDALIAALQILDLLIEEDKPMSEVGRPFTAIPQTLKNVRFGERDPLGNAQVQKSIAAAEQTLGAKGRVLIRKSGTEPLIRVMIESTDEALNNRLADDICDEIAATVLPKAKHG